MDKGRLNIILGGVVVVLVIIFAISTSSNSRLVKQLQTQKDTERKKSQKIVDSLEKIITLDSIILTRKIDSFNIRVDSLKGEYEKTLNEIEIIQQDITNYLVSSDSIRFAKFRELITEVD